ncbi:MAG TPA: DNA mismatch repair protein MutS [Bacteroidota bacterium]|nr:DNA mismatch repair protein MutS [Bacteroidota bacterium]
MSTPLMKQYALMKAKYPETVLLFRLGDFYETFEEDARLTSKVLGITLTKRGNGSAGDIPLAGFPHHALESYLPKLLKAGLRVAVCEQLEDPRLAKGLVKRDVIEVVSPGVAFSDKILEQKRNNYLLAVALPHALPSARDTAGVAFIDVTTADFKVTEVPFGDLAEQIASLAPAEILVQRRDLEALRAALNERYSGLYSKLDDWIFNFDYAEELLRQHFNTRTLKGFGLEGMRLGIVAAGGVMNYLQETQKANLLHIRKIIPFNAGDYIRLDPSTKRNLEITQSIDGREEGTLFWVLDRTRTPMGGRLLKQWINHPLKKADAIRARLSAVQELAGKAGLRGELGGILSNIGDLERLIAKVCTNRANPRDVVALKHMLIHVSRLKHAAGGLETGTLGSLHRGIRTLDSLTDRISAALSEDPPLSLAEGGAIKKGFSAELDELRDIALNGKSWIAALQTRERERTRIPSLKVGFNNVFGYYIEITNTHKEKVPASYVRKQTVANAERFITPELKEYEDKIFSAEEKIASLESRLFNELRLAIAGETESIQQNAGLVALLDCFVSLAEVATENNYVLPEIGDDAAIEIIGGRHPVIEKLLPPADAYTANDARLDTGDNQILIITGPNMSGKSSYLRQVGLIVLLAHIGSFVPAKSAHIGIVDRIYTRVGASDNIAAGESTFLVEMHEAANILNTATARSLILLDEVGRGTSTFDGISIAWALTEYLHDRIGAKTLFATHYHELNELADIFPRIKNFKVEVREYGDKVIFLHKVTPGFADHSYGIQVAEMAGMPGEVTARAKSILLNLERSELNITDPAAATADAAGPAAPKESRPLPGQREKPLAGRSLPRAAMQMPLFELKDDRLREELRTIDINAITPLEALRKLAEWKKEGR